LQIEHAAEAIFEQGQHPLDFFLAKLAEDLFQLGLGQLQLANGLLLLLDGALALGLPELLLGLVHTLLSGFKALSRGMLLGGTARRWVGLPSVLVRLF
jgi:hypothetical protein